MDQPKHQPALTAEGLSNPFLSTQKSSDSGLQITLHPLVLLTISDYIVRHALRNQKGPIVGALLGQQNGREITLEFAFECRMIPSEKSLGDYVVDTTWFEARLEQMRMVHTDRGLDFVGWYTMFSHKGPDSTVVGWNETFLGYNESAVLLAFHAADLQEKSVGGKLPLTIYESNLEVDDPSAGRASNDDEDKEMKEGEATLKLKFRELPFSVETGEAEMISMNYVAGATSATAASQSQDMRPTSSTSVFQGKHRGFTHDVQAAYIPIGSDNMVLSKEEEETIAALTAKANAIKMMDSRLKLLVKYLQSLPPSFVDGSATAAEASASGNHANPSHTILRSILALVSRLSIVEPSDSEEFQKELRSEANNVGTVTLLNDVLSSISTLRDIGKKFSVVETARIQKQRVADLGSGGGSGGHPFNFHHSGDLHAASG
ncbi:Cop9 signalosome subunit 6 [Pleurostoma richardsiae]|uniref:COP9 signalosome complex subunit 6 n=1 Tax=Pleurostoma richardsiae TaxID=41990 RepID=A0AA38RBQ4_9PEZI|nr:Cop9 signalosome subunit 6 [Pleurostoma richardsiae]